MPSHWTIGLQMFLPFPAMMGKQPFASIAETSDMCIEKLFMKNIFSNSQFSHIPFFSHGNKEL
jgi:hypothetical protein